MLLSYSCDRCDSWFNPDTWSDQRMSLNTLLPELRKLVIDLVFGGQCSEDTIPDSAHELTMVLPPDTEPTMIGPIAPDKDADLLTTKGTKYTKEITILEAKHTVIVYRVRRTRAALTCGPNPHAIIKSRPNTPTSPPRAPVPFSCISSLSFAAHNAVCLAGASPAAGIGCLPA